MTKYTGPFHDKNIPSKGTASTMTHSTCCKAEVVAIPSEHFDFPHHYECGKCKKVLERSEIITTPTPPPVPSEIEGEIAKILTMLLNQDCDRIYARKKLTALLTHHTSVQVKEAVEKIQNLNWWNKLYVQNTYGHYVTIGQEVLDDIIKIITAQAAEGEGEYD